MVSSWENQVFGRNAEALSFQVINQLDGMRAAVVGFVMGELFMFDKDAHANALY